MLRTGAQYDYLHIFDNHTKEKALRFDPKCFFLV